ncbi:MAG: carbohydrate ABC transporter substrate-binding protein [Chloroflexi bacterium]|nr:carbohydrate ABC transporter substrate-binding protein [Chloroflexota bacterium]
MTLKDDLTRVLFVGLLVVLTGCSNTEVSGQTDMAIEAGVSEVSSNAITAISFYVQLASNGQLVSPEASSFENMVTRFNEAHPEIRVSLEQSVTQRPSILEATRRYDCFVHYQDELKSRHANDLLSLSPLFEAESSVFQEDHASIHLADYRLEGELYGLPAVSRPTLMAYNADLLAQRGLELPSMDWTFEDFLELSLAAASLDDADRSYGIAHGDDLLFTNGRNVGWVRMSTYPPSAYFDGPQTQVHLNWLKLMQDQGVLLNYHSDNYKYVQQEITNGRVAFWEVLAGDPSLYYFDPEQELPFEVGVVPMPLVPDPERTATRNFLDRGYFISRHSEAPQACWEWIRFLSGQPDVFIGLPVRRSVQESQAWQALYGDGTAQAYLQAFAQRQPEHNLAPVIWPLNELRAQAIEDALNGGDVAQILADAQEKADIYLACIGDLYIPELADQVVEQRVQVCAEQINVSFGVDLVAQLVFQEYAKAGT